MIILSPLLITPEQLYKAVEALTASKGRIEQAVNTAGAEIEKIAGVSFLGNKADQLLQDYHQQRSAMEAWPGTLTALAAMLTAAADAFVKADQTSDTAIDFNGAAGGFAKPMQQGTPVALSDYGIILTGKPPTDEEKARIDAFLAKLPAAQKQLLAGKWTTADLLAAIDIINNLKTQYNTSVVRSNYQPGAWTLSELQAVQAAVQQMSLGLKNDFLAYFGADELSKLAKNLGVSEDNAVLRLLYPTITFARDDSKNVNYLLDKDGKTQYDDKGNAKVVVKPETDDKGNIVYQTDDSGKPLKDDKGKPIPKWTDVPDGIWYARAEGRTFILSDKVFFKDTVKSTLGLNFTTIQLITHEMSHWLTGSNNVTLPYTNAKGVTKDYSLANYYAAALTKGAFTVDGTTTTVTLEAPNDGYTISPRSSNYSIETVTDAVAANIWGAYTADNKGTIRRQQGTLLMRTILEAAMKRKYPTWTPPGSN